MDRRRLRQLAFLLSLLVAMPTLGAAQRQGGSRPSGGGGSARPSSGGMGGSSRPSSGGLGGSSRAGSSQSGGSSRPSPSPSGGSSRPSPSPSGGSARPSPSPSGGSSRPSPSPSGGSVRPSTPSSSRPASPVPSRTSPTQPSRPGSTGRDSSTPTRPSPSPADAGGRDTTPAPQPPIRTDPSATGPSRRTNSPPVRTGPTGGAPSSGAPTRSGPARTGPDAVPSAPAPSGTRPRSPAPEAGPPAVGTNPRRTPFPRPAAPEVDRQSGRSPAGPSSTRLERKPLGPSAGRAAPERRNETPSSGSRPIEREKIIERYQRGAADARADAKPDAKPDARREASADSVKAARDSLRESQAAEVRGKRDAARANATDATGSGDAVREKREGYRREQADAVSARRAEASAASDASRTGSADEVKARRDQYRTDQVKSERDVYRANQQAKIDKRTAALAYERSNKLRDSYEGNPYTTPKSWGYGKTTSSYCGWGLNVGFGLGYSWCNPYGYYWANNCWPSWYWNGWDYCNNYWYWWGCGGYSYSWLCHPFSWGFYWNYGCWPNYSYWWPSVWVTSAWAPPVYYSDVVDDEPDVVIYDYDDDNDIQVYGGNVEVRQGEGSGAVGEGVQYGGGRPVDPTVEGVLGGAGPDSAMRMVQQYLADGDAAFRERRYGDAAHYYAKAIELRPEEGVLYLVLSDALFATGDYHYGAFALRRALEFEPSLAQSDIDKREFYSDPAEFERQLQLLERFLADRPTDADARLLLAANYLFSRRPNLAIDLLEAGSSEAVRSESSGKLILDAAKSAPGR